nr:MAG TPA: hypothetical protein [Caudoviricetes sp.]
MIYHQWPCMYLPFIPYIPSYRYNHTHATFMAENP